MNDINQFIQQKIKKKIPGYPEQKFAYTEPSGVPYVKYIQGFVDDDKDYIIRTRDNTGNVTEIMIPRQKAIDLANSILYNEYR